VPDASHVTQPTVSKQKKTAKTHLIDYESKDSTNYVTFWHDHSY